MKDAQQWLSGKYLAYRMLTNMWLEVAFKFPLDADTKEEKSFPLVHKIPTISEKERKATLMQSNPEMFVPKVLV